MGGEEGGLGRERLGLAEVTPSSFIFQFDVFSFLSRVLCCASSKSPLGLEFGHTFLT